jgi:hypothetical protein
VDNRIEKLMALNLQNINKGIYFEFYLNDNLFYRYNYNPEELEIGMFSLCEYITRDIIKRYKYKKFTGTNYECRTILWFSILVNQKPIVADIDQSNAVSEAYPLDVNLSEQAFSINLYINVLLLLCNEIESESYLEELEKWKTHLQRHTTNLFWSGFPHYNSIFINRVSNYLRQKEEEVRIKQTNKIFNNSLIESIIRQLSNEIEQCQEQSYYVLSCFDIVSVQFNKYIRFVKYSKDSDLLSSIKDYLAIPRIKNDTYLNYINGNFKLLSNEQLFDTNRMMAYKLFIPKINNIQKAIDYSHYLQNQTSFMQSKKNEIVSKLYYLQEQTISVWKTNSDNSRDLTNI